MSDKCPLHNKYYDVDQADHHLDWTNGVLDESNIEEIYEYVIENEGLRNTVAVGPRRGTHYENAPLGSFVVNQLAPFLIVFLCEYLSNDKYSTYTIENLLLLEINRYFIPDNNIDLGKLNNFFTPIHDEIISLQEFQNIFLNSIGNIIPVPLILFPMISEYGVVSLLSYFLHSSSTIGAEYFIASHYVDGQEVAIYCPAKTPVTFIVEVYGFLRDEDLLDLLKLEGAKDVLKKHILNPHYDLSKIIQELENLRTEIEI